MASEYAQRTFNGAPSSAYNQRIYLEIEMKLMAAMVVGGVMTVTCWADTVKITIVREDASSSPALSASTAYVVEAGQSRVFDGMRTLAFEPTEGDCGGIDTKKLERQARDGEALHVISSHLVHDQVLIRLEYEGRKFRGTTEHAYSQRCKVNNPSSTIISFSQTSVLRKGAPPRLLNSSPEFKVFGVIEP